WLVPTSRSVTFVKGSAAVRMISLPTAALPVNAILSTSGCSTIAAPAGSPSPVTMLTTPGGSPASSKDDASSRTGRGGCAAGWSTTEQPAQIGGASFQVAISKG